ncbi:MAG: DUF1015 family protein [Acidimicrobiales bacterium]
MPRFEPFIGTRYDPDRSDLNEVTAPPYDVIGPAEVERLEDRSPHNVVRIDLSRDEAGRDRYTLAAERFRGWGEQGVLVDDDGPSYSIYRMSYRDDSGRPQRTLGVVGALELVVPDEGDVLLHERTLPKAKNDRLALMRACDANVSAVWGLSLAKGLSALCVPPDRTARWRCTDEDGVCHEMWRVEDAAAARAIAHAVGSAPVVIADGHHRYETALAFRDEHRASRGPGGDGAEDADLLMALIVELAPDQLTVRPIHRLVSGLPDGFDLPSALQRWFELADPGPAEGALSRTMEDAGALGLAWNRRRWLLRPRPGALPPEADLDSARLDAVLAGLPPHVLSYQHGEATVVGAVDKGEAQAGFLLRPATVEQIAAAARDRRRMPEKSTFFWPKPRTGLVMRKLSR